MKRIKAFVRSDANVDSLDKFDIFYHIYLNSRSEKGYIEYVGHDEPWHIYKYTDY